MSQHRTIRFDPDITLTLSCEGNLLALPSDHFTFICSLLQQLEQYESSLVEQYESTLPNAGTKAAPERTGDPVPVPPPAPAEEPITLTQPPEPLPLPPPREVLDEEWRKRLEPLQTPPPTDSPPRRSPGRKQSDLRKAIVAKLNELGRWVGTAELAEILEAPPKEVATKALYAAAAFEIAKRPGPPGPGNQPRWEWGAKALLGGRAQAGMAAPARET